MSIEGEVEQSALAPPLPQSIWVVAWISLAVQAASLIQAGIRLDVVPLVVSVVLGGLVFGYVSAGVVRARMVRLVVAWIVLALVAIGGIVGLATVDGPSQAVLAILSLAATVATLVALARFCRTDWYAWQRTKPSTREGAPIRRLVALGVLVGVLSGFAGPLAGGLDATISVAGL